MMAKPTSALGFSWATPVINTTTLVPSLSNTSMNIKKLPSKNTARKAPKRREKDHARAAAHQACLQSEAAARTKADRAAPITVELPFSGKLLPLKTKPSPAPSKTTTPSTSLSFYPSTPKKLSSTEEPIFKKYIDVNVVKKQLFPNKLSQGDQIPSSKNYQKREQNLWRRLFET